MIDKNTENYLAEVAIKISGAVIDGDYRDFGEKGGYFTSEGEIHDVGDSHPDFQLCLDDKIQIEIGGSLDYERTAEEYITKYSYEVPFFGTEA